MPSPAQIAAEWDRAAVTRERQISTGKDHSAISVLGPAVLKALTDCEMSHVLDVGCGTGWLTALVALRAGTVVGIDPSCVSLEIAAERHTAPNIRYQKTTIESFSQQAPVAFTAAIANMTL